MGFILLFSDLHLWASIFSVILANYIFMDGKSDYFQGKFANIQDNCAVQFGAYKNVR